MDNKIILKAENGQNQYKEIDEIRALLKEHNDKLTLVFESGKTDDDYRKALQNELTTYHVFNVRWKPEIWIYPSIPTDKILEHKELIYQAAYSFRKDGIHLMKTLGQAYQINPFEGRELFDFKKTTMKDKQRGKVNEEWNFYFHGFECQFENHQTGQLVELVITNGPEFGALDSYFFLSYLKTTPKFKELAEFFSDDSSAVTKALNLLEDLGMLKRINDKTQRGIIAL